MRLLQSIAMDKNLTYDKKRMLTYGMYQGYSISVQYDGNLRRYAVSAHCKLTEGVSPPPFQEFGQNLKQECKKVLQTESTDSRLTVFLFGSNANGKKERANMELVLERLIAFLRQNQYVDACPICGADTNVHWYDLNRQAHHICESCYEKLIDSMEANKQLQKQKRSNLFTGIIGALLGAVIGVVLWVIAAQMGYIVGVVGLVMAICTLKGYELFGGKINVLGIVICCTVLIVMIFLANVLDYTIFFYNNYTLEAGMSFFDLFRELMGYFLKFNFTDIPEFYRNLGVGYLFTLIAAIPTMISQFRTKSGSYTAGRIDAPSPPVGI